MSAAQFLDPTYRLDIAKVAVQPPWNEGLS